MAVFLFNKGRKISREERMCQTAVKTLDAAINAKDYTTTPK